MMVLIFVVAERAKPQFESYFDRAYRLNIRNCWDVEFVYSLLWITMIGVLVSTTGLILSIFRARRREDSSLLAGTLPSLPIEPWPGITWLILFRKNIGKRWLMTEMSSGYFILFRSTRPSDLSC